MPTLRSAAALLASAADLGSLAPIAAAIGCGGAPAPLDATARVALGIPDECAQALVARGPGALRALLLDVRGARAMREVLTQLAQRLSVRAPHLLWIALACRAAGRAGGETAIAAWAPGRAGPRVAALIVDRSHVVDSDAETLCALAAAMGTVDVLTHARWVAVLGREAVTRRFYRTLERLVWELAEQASGCAPEAARREIALLYASRLLFLSFLEAKEWLDGDRSFLARQYDDCAGARGGFQRRVLAPLFFGTLNTPVRSRAPAARRLGRIPFLNGGLFARSPVERMYASLEFRDEELGRFFSELLGRYRFTAREESSDWSEAAVDPEMLGRAFESLMATRERRDTGAFFTPHELVARVTDEALRHALGSAVDGPAGHAGPSASRYPADVNGGTAARLAAIRVLDPACGSGAFLVYALERISGLLAASGDPRPVPELRRAVLTSSIFGVDINPTAVWLCQLRLWLSIVIESTARDPALVAPLPNLDRNVRVGDALAGDQVGHGMRGPTSPIGRLRRRYARAVGARKRTLARALDRAERAHAVAALERRIDSITASRRDVLTAARARDLFGERRAVAAATRVALAELRGQLRQCRARRRALLAGSALPFSFPTHFADVAAAGGFDVVIGNPPWVRLHRIAPAARAALRREYASYRDAAWRDGAAAARAGLGFAAQVDLAALFIERSLAVARPGGVIALLVPAKLWRALAGGGVRRMLAVTHRVLTVEDWSDAASRFDAAVYPSMVVARRSRPDCAPPVIEVSVTVHAARVSATWAVHPCELGLDASAGAPWLLLPPQVRRAFDAVRAAGTPLADSEFGAPLLGVKCGCNDAYIVTAQSGRIVSHTGATVPVEPELLRPLVRGEHLGRWRVEANDERIIWTHGSEGRPLDRLPPNAERWLRAWRRRLVARSDVRGAARWWALFRTDAAACDVARVVWADFGRAPRAAVLPAGDATVPLNTCYVARCADVRDAFALAALLNSALVAAWLAPLAEPARGSYRRYLGWTMALLPLPGAWSEARALLAPAGERASAGAPPGDAELLELVTRAYGLHVKTIAPLLDWQAR